MNFSDDNPPNPPEENLPEQPSSGKPAESASAETLAQPLAVPVTPAAYFPPPNLPEDLRISWSWGHLLAFAVFFLTTQFTIFALVLTYATYRHIPQSQLKQLLESDPKLLVATTVVSFALIMLFLYV